MATQWGRCLSSFFWGGGDFLRFFMALLCVSQQGEFKNTIKTFWGKSMSSTFWQKKLRGKKILSSFPIDFFNRVMGRFSAWGAQKHHKNTF
jgi:hypothetical protein